MIACGLAVSMGIFSPIIAQPKSQPKKPAAKKGSANNSQGLSVFNVGLSAGSFNPSRGEKVDLLYSLSRPANVTIQVFDADQHLVRTLASKATRKAGRNKESWDGKDVDGKVTPNEAYFFCIEAEDSSQNKAVFDPITFSGGEFADITQGQVSRQTGTINYKLSQPSRVLLRVGIPGSGLLKTVVDWEPRPTGEITEYWNGKDDDGVINVWELKNHRMVLSYMTLPVASVITFGNNQYDFRHYKTKMAGSRPKKEQRPMTNSRQISPHFWKSRLTDRAFKVRLIFPEYDRAGNNTVPSVKDRLMLRVDVPEQDKAVLQNQQFEIILFVNTVFHAEEERGYLPFNYPWELKNLPPGEHVLMVNIISFGDQIGVGSRKIKVVK
jgi:hypothetical protein